MMQAPPVFPATIKLAANETLVRSYFVVPAYYGPGDQYPTFVDAVEAARKKIRRLEWDADTRAFVDRRVSVRVDGDFHTAEDRVDARVEVFRDGTVKLMGGTLCGARHERTRGMCVRPSGHDGLHSAREP